MISLHLLQPSHNCHTYEQHKAVFCCNQVSYEVSGSLAASGIQAQPTIAVVCKPRPDVMVNDYQLMDVAFQQHLATLRGLQLIPLQPDQQHPVGLVNTWESCFVTAVLQCLLATPPLAEFLALNIIHVPTSRCKATASYICLHCELSSVAKRAMASQRMDRSPVNPENISRNVQLICSR